MKKYLLILFCLYSTVNLAMEPNKSDVQIFKHKKCGYELEYPKSWVISTDDPADDKTNLLPPVDEAISLSFELKDAYKLCSSKNNCSLGVACFGDGTDIAYEKSLDFIENSIKHEKIMNPRPSRIQETRINDYKAEIVVRDARGGEYFIYTYIYCENTKRFFDFGASKKYNLNYNNFSDLIKKPISIESLFNAEQQLIINSFKCPDANFTYKKPEKPKIKKK